MTDTMTRPIIGIENRTAQEVFDIMCDRIKHAPGRLHGPYGWLNGHRALNEENWTLEMDPLENSEEYFAIPLYALSDPFVEIGRKGPDPATPDQLEVVGDEMVARFNKAYREASNGIAWFQDGSNHDEAVKTALSVILTAANERAELAERQRDQHIRNAADSFAKSCASAERAENAEALNTTLSEALKAAGDEISSAMMDDNKQRFHRLNKLRHTIRTALAALPAKQGGSDEA